MRHLARLAVAWLILGAGLALPASAQIRISELPAATAVADADQTIIVQGGVTKRATAALVRDGLATDAELAAVQAANPSASIGLSAVNGVATTYMRSDAAQALSQAIVPTWTATHNFSTILARTDNTYDIGASGATRFRDLFLARNASIGGTLSVTGVATFTTAPVFGTPVLVSAGRSTKATVTIATATFTPNFDTAADFEISLTSACPCTLANPSTTPVAGQKGVIYVTQDATGSRTIGTYGSFYKIPSTGITLTTTASRTDVLSYVVRSATQIVLTLGAVNVPQ